MATVELEGFAELDRMFQQLGNLPFDVIAEALEEMAEPAERAVRESGLSMGVRDPESRVHILDNITHTKPKQTSDGGACKVTFKGSRTRGRKKTRNAEIAFLNEYGKRGQAARPFIRQAAESSGPRVAEAGARVIEKWIDDSTQK